jgi:hypothetical protein
MRYTLTLPQRRRLVVICTAQPCDVPRIPATWIHDCNRQPAKVARQKASNPHNDPRINRKLGRRAIPSVLEATDGRTYARWLLCRGRRTVLGLIARAGPEYEGEYKD